MKHTEAPRRDFLRYVSTLAALSKPALGTAAAEKDRVTFPPIETKTEKPEKTEPPGDPGTRGSASRSPVSGAFP